MSKSYKQTLDFLFEQLPVFQHSGGNAYKEGLDNIIALCSVLGNPQNKFPAIHVAGTNGKGSTSHMLAAVLQKAGYKTGLYTSPHLKDFRERIRINGKMIGKKEVLSFVEQYQKDFSTYKPSFFEWTTALAFHHFRNEKVDIAIIETGMGGRLDSTNIIKPLISVITNIGLDHVQYLGDTLAKIAVEKAGIIKPKTAVVIGESQPETFPVFWDKAMQERATIYRADQLLETEVLSRTQHLIVNVSNVAGVLYKKLELDLNSDYQLKNLCTVLQTLHVLKHQGFDVPKTAVRKGLYNARKLSGLRGRWEQIQTKPRVVFDTAHNKDGIALVMEQLKHYTFNKLHIVLGMVADKDIKPFLNLLPDDAHYYFCNARIPRALAAEELRKKALSARLQGEAYPTVKKAYKAALEAAKTRDFVLVVGSNFTVAELL